MKKYVFYIVISILLIVLSLNIYFLCQTYIKVNSSENELQLINKEIDDINIYIKDNQDAYDVFTKNNKNKIEVYEKWQRKLEEVQKAL